MTPKKADTWIGLLDPIGGPLHQQYVPGAEACIGDIGNEDARLLLDETPSAAGPAAYLVWFAALRRSSPASSPAFRLACSMRPPRASRRAISHGRGALGAGGNSPALRRLGEIVRDAVGIGDPKGTQRRPIAAVNGRSIFTPRSFASSATRSMFGDDVLDEAAARIGGNVCAEAPQHDHRAAVAKAVLRRPEDRVFDGRELLETHELAVKLSAALDVGDGQADLDLLQRFSRGVQARR